MSSRAAIDSKPQKKSAVATAGSIGGQAQKAQSPKSTAPKSPAQKALEKLGLRRDIDLALHLPLR